MVKFSASTSAQKGGGGQELLPDTPYGQRDLSHGESTVSKVRTEVLRAPLSWKYHQAQIDTLNKYSPLGSKKNVRKMMDLLMGNVAQYRRAFKHASDANPEIRESLDQVTVNDTNAKRICAPFFAMRYQEDDDSSDDEQEAAAVGAEGLAAFGTQTRAERSWMQKHDKSADFVMCLLSRMYNSHTKCFMLLAMSCVFLSVGLPRSTWSLMLSLGMVYTYENVEELLLDIGRDNMKWPEGTSKSIGFCVSDNCAYQSNIVFQHAEKDGAFIETVNYLYFPIRAFPNGKVPELPASGRWQKAHATTYEAIDLIMKTHERDERNMKLDEIWSIFLGWHKDDVLLHHPDYRSDGESKVIYMPPLIGISTAAYDDVDQILQRAYDECIVERGQRAVLMPGDQQTFNRMLHLKLAYPIKYSWAIPVSGDFHYQFHFASGIHRLAYLPFLKWFVDATGMHKTIPKGMDDTKHIKYMDHFYQLVIKSVLTYLTDVYGHEYMSKKPSEILEEQKLNNGICILVRMLHEYLLPWFGIRNALRCNDADYLDWSWRYATPLFVASGKTQYAAYAVQITTIVHMMCPVMKSVWHHYRTASLTGRKGRNVAWDYVLEKMNLNFKQFLSGHVTEQRLLKFGVMINATKHIRKTFEAAWRRVDHDFQDDEGGEYSHVRDEDVAVIVDALKDLLGGKPDVVDQTHRSATWGKNPFANNTYKFPWDKVEDDCGPEKLRAHCRLHARMPAEL